MSHTSRVASVGQITAVPGISSESTKLSHTIAMLQPEIAQEVRDILMIITDASHGRGIG